MSASRTLKADSLALGISVMLVVTIVQRGVGFLRGILFCRYLDDASLGQWAMGFGFISLITPMLLFGLPGSLPRFVEHYLQKGQLRSFLRRVLGLTSLITVLGLSTMLLFPGLYAGAVFGESDASQLVFGLAAAVLAVIVFNVTNELTSGLRMVRVASVAQFVQSIAFTVLGVGWLLGGGGIAGVLVMFAIASLLGTVPAWWTLFRGWESVGSDGPPLERRAMWKRLAPYAAALWAMNLLSNAFELADRYMLLHLTTGDATMGQRFLGQYHSSLIIPCLFISLANMGSSVLTPYLVADWEREDREAVVKRIERTLITISLGFTAIASVALWVTPWIFQHYLAGRYNGGLAVMPVCFVFCIWFSIATLAQCYLWVSERGKWVAAVMAVGLATNVGLNALLVPRIGLDGAVWGTLVSHLVVLCGVFLTMRCCGYPLSAVTVWVTLVPATLLAGTIPALACLVAAGLASSSLRDYLRNLAGVAGCQIPRFAR